MTTTTSFGGRPRFDEIKLEHSVAKIVGDWKKQYRVSSIVIYRGADTHSKVYPPFHMPCCYSEILPRPTVYQYDFSLKWEAARALCDCMRHLIEYRDYSKNGKTSFAGEYAIACIEHTIVILDSFQTTDAPFWQYIKQNAKGFFYVNISDYMVKEEN